MTRIEESAAKEKEYNQVDFFATELTSVKPANRKRKKPGIVALVILLVIAVIIFVVINRPVNRYSLEVLSKTEEIKPGEDITITALVENKGRNEGSYTVLLSVDGSVYEEREISIGGGGRKEIDFIVSDIGRPGTYTITLNDWAGSFRIVEPAVFLIENFNLTPNPVVAGQESTVNVLITNKGETAGIFALTFLVDQELEFNRELELKGNESMNFSMPLVMEEPGLYHVVLNEIFSDYLSVLQPAMSEITSFSLTPSSVRSGQETAAMVKVTNTGDVDGKVNVSLSINGDFAESKTLDLSKNSSGEVTFFVARQEPGDYFLSVNGLSRTLTVMGEGELPERDRVDRLRTGTIIGRKLNSGSGELVIINSFNQDALLIMASPYLSNPLQGVYIRGNESFTITGIPDRAYSLYLTYGQDWDSDRMRFRVNASHLKYKGTVKIMPDLPSYSDTELILEPLVNWERIEPERVPSF